MIPNFVKRKAYARFNLEGTLKQLEEMDREASEQKRPQDNPFADN